MPPALPAATFTPRLTQPLTAWRDPDGVKAYAISADGREVEPGEFGDRLLRVKQARGLDWAALPAFVIFHRGATQRYLVLGWWQNGNELFTSVSAQVGDAWVEDPARFSFCLWDLEVIWHERNSFIRHLYSGQPDLAAYRRDWYRPGDGVGRNR